MARAIRFSRAEFLRLKAAHESLQAEFAALREQVVAARNELRIQFQRIAEIQAVLDEERIDNTQPREPRPLIRHDR